jgi:hypothetical protein
MNTTLPARYQDAVETEALTFAREQIARYAHGSNPWSDDPALSPKGSEALFDHMRQVAAQLTAQLASQSALARMQIIAAAKDGDPDAIEVLRTVLIECKSRRVEMHEMPTELIEYDMWLTAHGERRQRQRPGPKTKRYVLRDLCIAITVADVVGRYGHHGIKATGRSHRRLRPACSIVAEAVQLEANLVMDYDAVKAIWVRYGRRIT